MIEASAVLITKNEEDSLPPTLAALKDFAEIVVVDSESQDRTRQIAENYGCRVFIRPFDNFSDQKNYGIEKASKEWILSVDADEVVSPKLRTSLCEITQKGSDFDGFYIRRTNFIFGKQLRYGGQSSKKVPRFFRKGKGRFERPIHERLVVRGKLGELSGELFHYSSGSMEEYLRKLAFYTGLEAQWLARQGVQPTRRNLWFKPFLRFFYHYFLRFGFLDGYEGFLYHVLSSFYYYIKYARLKEMSHGRITERTEPNLSEAAV